MNKQIQKLNILFKKMIDKIKLLQENKKELAEKLDRLNNLIDRELNKKGV